MSDPEIGQYYFHEGMPRKCQGVHIRTNGRRDPYFRNQGDWGFYDPPEGPLTEDGLKSWVKRIIEINSKDNVSMLIGEIYDAEFAHVLKELGESLDLAGDKYLYDIFVATFEERWGEKL